MCVCECVVPMCGCMSVCGCLHLCGMGRERERERERESKQGRRKGGVARLGRDANKSSEY